MNTKTSIPSCKKLFTVELFIFKLIGLSLFGHAFDRNDYDTKKLNYKYREIIFILAAFCPIFFLFLSLIKTVPYYFGSNFSLTCYIMALLFSSIIVLIKFIRLWTHRLEFYKVFKILNTIWEESIRIKIDLKDQITKIIDNIKPLRYFHISVTVVLCFCYILRPYILLLTTYLSMSQNDTIIFADLQAYSGVMYLMKVETYSRCFFLLIIENQIVFFASIYFGLCDILFITLTTVITVNFIVLTHEYLNIFEIYVASENNLETISSLIRRHCLLLRVCRKITYLFSPIVLSTVILNGIDICCSIFSLKQDLAVGEEKNSMARNLPHILILLVQILTYCNCAHIATEWSEALREAIYNSSWIDGDKKIVRAVIIVMINSQKEFNFTAYGLFVLNRQQLTQIFNTTTSYFMLLRNFA